MDRGETAGESGPAERSGPFAGRSAAVIGASSGIGKGVAQRLIEGGASVLVVARRGELLQELVDQAGAGVALSCDLQENDAGAQIAAQLARVSDRVDLVFVSAGSAPLQPLRTTTADDWRQTLETNLVGVNRLIAAILPMLHLESIVFVVSSETAVLPRSHLGAYGASKAALEHSVQQWREEHPWLRITAISLGATMPTDFAREFEPQVTMEALTAWSASGRNQEAFMATDEVCALLVDVMGTMLRAPSVGLERLEMRSPSPVAADLAFTKRIEELS
jgi:NAD(P)-dependent dehydrogenase (short-subunit alcohol dehydrogenase family)